MDCCILNASLFMTLLAICTQLFCLDIFPLQLFPMLDQLRTYIAIIIDGDLLYGDCNKTHTCPISVTRYGSTTLTVLSVYYIDSMHLISSVRVSVSAIEMYSMMWFDGRTCPLYQSCTCMHSCTGSSNYILC